MGKKDRHPTFVGWLRLKESEPLPPKKEKKRGRHWATEPSFGAPCCQGEMEVDSLDSSQTCRGPGSRTSLQGVLGNYSEPSHIRKSEIRKTERTPNGCVVVPRKVATICTKKKTGQRHTFKGEMLELLPEAGKSPPFLGWKKGTQKINKSKYLVSGEHRGPKKRREQKTTEKGGSF